MRRALAAVSTRGTTWLIVGIAVGILVPPLSELLRPALAPLFVVVLAITVVRLDLGAIRLVLAQPVRVLAVVAFTVAGAPLAMWALTATLPMEPALRTALVLMACTAPVTSAPAFALMAGLDAALCAVAVLVTTALLPVSAPWLALDLLALDLNLDVVQLMARLGGLIGAAVALGLLVRALVPKATLAREAAALDGLLAVLMCGVGIALMQGIGLLALERPGTALTLLIAAVGANAVLQALGVAAFAWDGAKRAFAVGLMSGNRNMAILIAALPATVDPLVLHYFAIAQIPMFATPLVIGAAYRAVARS
jgi:BASS family bile acid:Na+ symporter